MEKWLMIGLHIYSIFSDGMPMQEIAKIFGERSFDVIAFTTISLTPNLRFRSIKFGKHSMEKLRKQN